MAKTPLSILFGNPQVAQHPVSKRELLEYLLYLESIAGGGGGGSPDYSDDIAELNDLINSLQDGLSAEIGAREDLSESVAPIVQTILVDEGAPLRVVDEAGFSSLVLEEDALSVPALLFPGGNGVFEDDVEGLSLQDSRGFIVEIPTGDLDTSTSSLIAPSYLGETYVDPDQFLYSIPNGANYCFILPTLGQSNAAGTNTDDADPTIAGTAVYPGNALMLINGPRHSGSAVATLTDLVETRVPGALGETAASGWANHVIRDLEAAVGTRIKTLSLVTAIGASRYIQLKRGNAAYRNFIQALQAACQAVRAAGMVPIVPAIDWMGNESDNRPERTSTLRYKRHMKQLARNLADDITAITGQTEDPVLLISQIASMQSGPPTSPVKVAVHSLDGDGPIRVAGPIYQYPHTDIIHLKSIGQNRRGQALARATLEEVFGGGWHPLIDVAHRWVSSTVFEIDFDTLFPPIVLDISNAVVQTSGLGAGQGFVFDDRSGAPPTITAVTVIGTKTVRFTLSAAPTGLSCRVTYAIEPNAGNTDTGGPEIGPRGCLRDSAAHLSAYDATSQNNWALAFIREIGRP